MALERGGVNKLGIEQAMRSFLGGLYRGMKYSKSHSWSDGMTISFWMDCDIGFSLSWETIEVDSWEGVQE